jgi:sulfide:quinone oxidoreductase
MAKIVVLGAGVSGHTAAAFLKRWLGKNADVTVLSPKPDYNWLPSNIWVGLGRMAPADVLVPLAPAYERAGITFKQARAISIYPEGSAQLTSPHVEAESTLPGTAGARELVPYDFLINATGPRLKFEATEGLGPDANSLSVCTADHAGHAATAFLDHVNAMKQGAHRKFVVGTGHGACTCEGAAFEYVVNLEYELRRHGVRDRAQVTFLSNEYELGDFGMGGAFIRRGGYITPTNIFTASLFAERGIDWIIRSHVQKVEPNRIHYKTLDSLQHELNFDFAMLLPPFSGVGLHAFDRNGADITAKLFAPNGFMKVDGNYESKPYDQWSAADWPSVYRNPSYGNIFAVGIAFAPPHAISQPHFTTDGQPIFAAPPRTGMPSATIGKAVARSIANTIQGRKNPLHTASMAEMGAACVASTGAGLLSGTAAVMTVFPIVPDFQRFPEYGRELKYTMGEIGLAGHWIKLLLHYMFLYKASLKPGWQLIPE